MPNREFTLTHLQKIVLKEFAESSLKDRFYWTGGTALAFFHLHHRLSYDLDFFSDKAFSYEEILKFIQHLSKKIDLKKIEQKKIFDRWEFIIRNKENVKIEFARYEFKNLKPRKIWHGIFVDSLEDMATNKTMAMIDRHEPKDVFDIYFLLRQNFFKPQTLLNLVEKKFGVKFPIALFWSEAIVKARQLAELKPLLMAPQKEKLLKEITNFIEEQSAETVKKIIR
ncbi:MAG: nucleotidyl transferase AbiEii/AbiGii toxin family protein [Candidatus Liptonbacteria bacterium]|nr:nucleotidyl transferase AbiEii/AbiGii toxin family protein [Candidatus Liptonbacteria bacterium]